MDSPAKSHSRRLGDFTALNAIAHALNSAVNLEEALRESLARVIEVMGLSTGWIFLFTDEGRFRLAADHGLPPALARNGKAPLNPQWCSCQGLYRDGLLGSEVENVECSRLASASGDKYGLRNHASVPLRSGDRFVGIMNVATTDWDLFKPEDLQLLSAVGSQMGVAIERARLSDQARRLAVLEERSRMARELHDSVTQTLFSLGLTAEAALKVIPKDLELAAEHLESVNRLGKEALSELREMIDEMRPSLLEEEGLGAAIRGIPERLTMHAKVNVKGERSPSPEAEVAIYWIAREALQNVSKHASAGKVEVTLELNESETVLVVCDDGVGFDPSESRDTGFGLRSMRSRAEEHGGSISIRSDPGHGTRVHVRMPAR